MDKDLLAVLKENLSPTALRVYVGARAIKEIGDQLCRDLDTAEAEVVSGDGSVCAVCDGQGFLTDLVIADWAITELDVDVLEETISDAMVQASGQGQGAGEKILAELDGRLTDAGLNQ